MTENHTTEDASSMILKAFGLTQPTIKFELTIEVDHLPKITHTYWQQELEDNVPVAMNKVMKQYNLVEMPKDN